MKDIDIEVKMRLIGYYMSDDQFMRTEAVFPEKAEKLAELLRTTFDTILENNYLDDEMKTVFNGNTVFILKGENGWLYGYYPKYNVARLTNVHYVKPDVTPMPHMYKPNVHYVKPDVTPMPHMYKRWFYPGKRFHLYKPVETSSDIE